MVCTAAVEQRAVSEYGSRTLPDRASPMQNRRMPHEPLRDPLSLRFGSVPEAVDVPGDVGALARMAAHRSHRTFQDRPVDEGLLRLLCAVAFSAPSKSDLQQRDVLVVRHPVLRRDLEALMPSVDWLPGAPVLLVICANNRRQRRLHELRGHPFANDHLDAFFNAATDAAILLAWLVAAAEAAGLGCCPISAIRNRAEAVGRLLYLPDHVFPYAGLAIGWPADEGVLNPRLPLAATVHADRFDDADLPAHVADADRRRVAQKPFAKQRATAELGTTEPYGWSEDVARQYSRLERADFGAYVRAQGFKLD